MAGKWLHNEYPPSRDEQELKIKQEPHLSLTQTDVNVKFLKYIQI